MFQVLSVFPVNPFVLACSSLSVISIVPSLTERTLSPTWSLPSLSAVPPSAILEIKTPCKTINKWYKYQSHSERTYNGTLVRLFTQKLVYVGPAVPTLDTTGTNLTRHFFFFFFEGMRHSALYLDCWKSVFYPVFATFWLREFKTNWTLLMLKQQGINYM